MNVYAAIDLRGGAAVQLVGGDPAEQRVSLPDPAEVARRWAREGFRHFHVVDLDAALGAGANDDAVAAVAEAIRTPAPATVGAGPATGAARAAEAPGAVLQVGGGVRDRAAVERVLALGADRVVVGTRAVEDRPWLEAAASAFPERLVVAADVKDGVVVTRGWRESTALRAETFLAALADLPLAAILVTDVRREGRQEGIDGGLFARLVAAAPHPLIAAGGVADTEDIATLRDAGAAGAVLGMALYTGRIAPAAALELGS